MLYRDLTLSHSTTVCIQGKIKYYIKEEFEKVRKNPFEFVLLNKQFYAYFPPAFRNICIRNDAIGEAICTQHQLNNFSSLSLYKEAVLAPITVTTTDYLICYPIIGESQFQLDLNSRGPY